MKRSKPGNPGPDRLMRQRIAFEAAKLMAVQGLQDFRHAKLKAAEKLGIRDDEALPSNAEVQQQLLEYQRLFHGRAQAEALHRRRLAALEAMGFFKSFSPRLVGSVLDGSADANSPIRLHVFTDDASAFARFLDDSPIPAQAQADRRLRLSDRSVVAYPAWAFVAEGLAFELTVLPLQLLRQAPLDPVAERPMQQASPAAVEKLLGPD